MQAKGKVQKKDPQEAKTTPNELVQQVATLQAPYMTSSITSCTNFCMAPCTAPCMTCCVTPCTAPCMPPA